MYSLKHAKIINAVLNMKKILLWLMLLVATNGFAQQINYAEYFIDNTVAVGSGTPITITAPVDSVDLTFNVSTTGLTSGFHNLNVRVRYNTGLWAMYENRIFYVNPANLNAVTPKIGKAEYYIDSDTLGVGKRTVLLTGSLADSVNTTSNIGVLGVAPGFHNLNIRMQDSIGIWGMFESRVFYINPTVQNVSSPKITKAEYYIDSDTLGVGKRTVLLTGALADSVNTTSNIGLTGIAQGFHYLMIRTQDSAGIWGMFESRVFYINDTIAQVISPKITSAEYFYNAEPGIGNGIAISPSFALSDSINLTRTIATTGLPVGMDTLYIRVKDSLGIWSLPVSKVFRICNTAPTAPTVNGNSTFNICAGSTVNFSATPATGSTIVWRGPNNFTSTSNSISITNINNTKTGNYYAYSVIGATACDTSASALVSINIVPPPTSQSLSVSRALSFCSGDSAILSTANQTGFSYRWHLNGVNTTNAGDTLSSLNAKTGGTYNVLVTNANGCSSTMNDTIVNAYPKPTTTAIIGNTTVMVSTTQTYSVTNTTGSTYYWIVSNGTITSGIGSSSVNILWSNTAGSGSVKTIETNNNSCKGDTIAKSITINAVIPDSLSLNTDTIHSPFGGNNTTVNITSNRSWTVGNNQTWASVNPALGTGNGSFSVTTVNNTGADRNATITVTAGTIVKTVYVLQLHNSTGINNVLSYEKQISVYPNPSTGMLFINNESEENFATKVMDMNGKLIDEFLMNAKTEKQMNYGNLSQGIYLIQLISNDKVMQRKIVITR